MLKEKQMPLKSLKPPTGLCNTRRKSLPRNPINKGITCFINRKQKDKTSERSSSPFTSRFSGNKTDEMRSTQRDPKTYLRNESMPRTNRKSGVNFARPQKVEMQRMSHLGINLNEAAKQVLRTSVLIENKACENINVGIRIRPFTKQEIAANQLRGAWIKSADEKLIDKKKGLVYGFGNSSINNRQCILARKY
jgi:hypothetical protein